MSRRYSRMPNGRKQDEDVGSHWMSYSDLMSALLLLFALLLMISLLSNQTEVEARDQLIDEVLGVKTKIVEELNEAFSDSNLEMEVDPQTGAIRFSSGVFFELNSYEVSKTGKKNLEEFIPVYIGILLSDQFRDHISEIIVEGHTDQQGSYIYNLDLSQNRSLSVVKHILSEDFPKYKHDNELRDLLTSNGRSFSEPILGENGEVSPEKSRRVEFKFRLKDDEVIKEIEKMVNANE
ncbi:OmpA family protein [Alkalihalobacillus deserti]|uniref:OmpA family protein n=1 Tax=Alkalihalobacillus deserti TaxID=2879466 RepID=UPI001D1396BD|nr:OmpA family protein [Alkalihalobacillus deserti]